MPKDFKLTKMVNFFCPDFMQTSLSKETKAVVLCMISEKARNSLPKNQLEMLQDYYLDGQVAALGGKLNI